jgi:hypothetical protein
MTLIRENHHRLKVVQAPHFLKCASESLYERTIAVLVVLGGTSR